MMNHAPSVRLVRTNMGRWHRVVVLDGRRLTDERCNLDDSPAEQEIAGDDVAAVAAADADPADLCGWCFRR